MLQIELNRATGAGCAAGWWFDWEDWQGAGEGERDGDGGENALI